MFDQLCLGIDVSHWQPTIHWDALKTAGVRFAIIKASQGNHLRDLLLGTHLNNARAAGMITGVYHYFDPGCMAATQLSNLKGALEGREFDFLALDVEQYLRSNEPDNRTNPQNRYSSIQISNRSEELAGLMRANWQKPVVIYTRATFVSEYAAEMRFWLKKYPLWLAHYPYPGGRVSLSWETLKARYKPSIAGPWLPTGCDHWQFWQFSGDKFVLPGVNGPLDLNFFNGSLQELQSWLGLAVDPVQQTIEERLEILWKAHPQLWQKQEVQHEPLT